MSAQAGIWNFDGKPVEPKLLAEFSDALKQQGPHGEFFLLNGNIAMLYRPFQTTVESRREKQPYLSRRGFVLTWDGRLDNREELIADLRDDLDADPTDVEIVAAVFDRGRTDGFRHIIGDWAVSIWSPQERELVLAADYMAIRHIFYYPKPYQILWSTDLASLVSLSRDTFQIDYAYIAGYFANDPDAHLTPYRGLYQVPAGHFVRIFNEKKISPHRYWSFDAKTRIRYRTDAEYEEHFRHTFRSAVRRRLRADGSVLAELSGGLDSSSIVCMADDILAKEGAQTNCLDTISFYDNTEPSGDDWIYFHKIEDKRGKIGAHIDASKYAESPLMDSRNSAPIPGHLGAGHELQAARAAVVQGGGYRVLLSGLGGDEFMGGIPDPRAHLADLIVQLRLFDLMKRLTDWSLVKRRPCIHLLWQASIDLLPRSLRQVIAKEAKVAPWIDKQFAKRTGLAAKLLGPRQNFGVCLPTRRSYIGGVLLMANKMAKRLPPTLAVEESRYPYLDQNLIEFILSIPADQVLRPGERRSLMRRALRGLVPQEILSRRTKQVGARRHAIVLQSNWTDLQMAFSSSLSARLGFIDEEAFLLTMNDALNGKSVPIVRLMKTISLELWLRNLAFQRLLSVEAPSSQPVMSEAAIPML